MPFTLSHAAAVLPGIRRSGHGRGPFLASALVMGSFAPDMTYFAASVIPGAMEFGSTTHSLPGVLTVDAVITAVLVGCWLLLREPLVALLPAAWRGRTYALLRGAHWPGGRPPARLLGAFYLSAVAGSLTHVGWDSFTHLDRYGTNALPWLSGYYGGFPLYTYLQYGSSALAAGALLWFLVSALRRLPAGPVPASVPALGRAERVAAFALVAGCVAVGVTFRVLRFYTYFDRIRTPLDIVPTVCFGAGSGLMAGLVLYAALFRLRHRGAVRPPGHDRHRDPEHDQDRTRTPGSPAPAGRR
ncbi:DUF4184 domain-containing protein [Streptomyces venezuelae]|uniref:DUF4184 domain-containing protein n=1 Tax=Streptomyces venezuelae TaxID=54571 RepID=A0A5P2DC37_STRVZ|nr:DUF4184 family protein [Streptomyces venezuelae]QES50659.1 DUF4184 domain-containing protein [Streptomyces venezuelae]